MTLSRLPGWVVDDATSVREEVAPLRGTTPAERWSMARRCARDAMWALSVGGMRERALAMVDPLPESTLEALARLRTKAREGGAR